MIWLLAKYLKKNKKKCFYNRRKKFYGFMTHEFFTTHQKTTHIILKKLATTSVFRTFIKKETLDRQLTFKIVRFHSNSSN